jgi:hypothetical protein
MTRHAGKVALVTGASRGIGESIARLLASDGAHVAPRLAPRNFVSPANQKFKLDCGPEQAKAASPELVAPGRAGWSGTCGVRVLAGAAGRPGVTSERKLSRVTAQPTEDPADPLVILRDLPEREHEEFLHQYHRAVDAAHDPAGYQHLRRLLHVWSLTAIAAGQPGYYEELAAAVLPRHLNTGKYGETRPAPAAARVRGDGSSAPAGSASLSSVTARSACSPSWPPGS